MRFVWQTHIDSALKPVYTNSEEKGGEPNYGSTGNTAKILPILRHEVVMTACLFDKLP